MKYYLLTFDEVWAGKHYVPALECLTEKEYNDWLYKELVKLNPNYEKEIINYNAYQKAKKELDLEIKEKLGDNWKSIKYTDWPKDLRKRYDSFPRQFGYKRSYPECPIKIIDLEIKAYLGNSEDDFGYQFNHCHTGKDFVDSNYVVVTEVTKDFYNIFRKTNLSLLSLCNIFD
jgi:hypothetical protein